MRIIDAFRIGSKSLTTHKKHNFMTIVVVSVLFGLLFGVNFILQGLKNQLLALSSEKTQGKHLVKVGLFEESGLPSQNKEKIDQVKSKVAEYGGKVIGTIDVNEQELFITADLAQYLFKFDHSKVPDGAVPVVIGAQKAQDLLNTRAHNRLSNEKKRELVQEINQKIRGQTFTSEDERAALERNSIKDGYLVSEYDQPSVESEDQENITYFVVDVLSAGMTDPGLGKLVSEIRPLDFVLKYISGHGQEKIAIRSGQIDRRTTITQSFLVEFQDTDKLFKYYLENDCNNIDNGCRDLHINDAFGNVISILHSFMSIYFYTDIITAVLAIIASIIIIFSFLRLINQETSNIALFKIMGAERKDVVAIYLAFLLEMAVLTILASLLIGLMIATLVSLVESADLTANLSAFYNSQVEQFILLYGVNLKAVLLIAVIPVAALLTITLTFDQLSNKNVFKNLR